MIQEREGRAFRFGVYLILAMLASSWIVSRVMTIRSGLGATPLLSANDRSRWSTIRALVDHGTYEIDEVIFLKNGKRNREWYSIDMVVHRGADGREHYYSSKPPLLSTMVAGEYWLVKKITGEELANEPFYLVRLMLLITNLLPLLLMWWLIAEILERCGQSDWGRIYVAAVATFGTFLTTFAVTLNNHLPAAVAVAATGYALWRITAEQSRQIRYFVIAGFASAFAAANELPALLLLVGSAAIAIGAAPRRAIWAFTLPALVVAAAFFGTNQIAHQSWRPPYDHRQDGPVLAQLQVAPPAQKERQPVPSELRAALTEANIQLSDEAALMQREPPKQWMIFDPQNHQRYALDWNADRLEVRAWDNWYEYDLTYWTPKNKKGVDRGERSPLTYAFHAIIGHHGVFSLTPVWLLSLWGAVLWLRSGNRAAQLGVCAILTMALICTAFYLTRPEHDRNYGGVSCGFRWLFWQIPLWIFCLIPAADRLAATRAGRLLAIVLLGISAFSAMYGANNPWSHPWLFDYWTSLGWIEY